MFKVPRVLLLVTLCSSVALSATVDPKDHSENVLQIDQGLGIKEVKVSSLITKCHDEETKTAYKVDSVWYPEGKCEKRTCSRQKNSKTPIIKTMECEPCTTCSLPNHTCQPFRPEKHFPKCCDQCLTKSTVLKKTNNTKNYQKYQL